MNKKIVYITGALGFIGRYVTQTCLDLGWQVYAIDKVTYASDKTLLNKFYDYNNFRFEKIDINDLNFLYDCDYIINLAAETHVDNSIINSEEFIKSNINGVHNLLKLIYTKHRFNLPTLLHFSTDEVYGDITNGTHTESQILSPSNPYSATKASADMLISAWNRTYNIPYIIVRPSNNYGIGQYVEKFIPKCCKYLSLGKKVPLHENGLPIRTWLHAQDTADAVIHLINNQATNQIFNISGNYEDSNLNVFKKILKFNNIDPNRYDEYADFSVKRPGQDVRYSVCDNKLRSLNWSNQKIFDDELQSIVEYYQYNFIW